MDSKQFRAAAHQMIDYVIDYMENIRDRYLSFFYFFFYYCYCYPYNMFIGEFYRL